MGAKGSKSKSHFDILKEADALVKAGQGELAIELYNEAVEANPSYYIAYLGRGKCLIAMGEYQEAIEDFNVAMELSEECHAARMYKVSCLEEMEEFELAAMERSKIPPEVRRHAEEYSIQKNIVGHPLASSFSRSPGAPEGDPKPQRSEAPRRAGSFSAGVVPTATAADGASPVSDSDTVPSTPQGTLCHGDDRVEFSLPSAAARDDRRLRAGDVIDDVDVARFEAYSRSWHQETKRQKNIQDFLHGRRGWYVQSKSAQKRAEQRAERQSQMTMYDLGTSRGKDYARVGH